MKNNVKAFIGMIIGTLISVMILENYHNIAQIWYFQIPILFVFAASLILFVHVGRWVQLSWDEQENKNQ